VAPATIATRPASGRVRVRAADGFEVDPLVVPFGVVVPVVLAIVAPSSVMPRAAIGGRPGVCRPFVRGRA